MKLAADRPHRARVIERRPDGSARVEVPIITVADSINLSRTEGGGTGSLGLTVEMFEEMRDNFAAWPKPVGVGFDGFDGHQNPDGGRGGPQAVFVDSLSVRDGALVGVLDITDPAMAALVVRGAYRGFSIEALRDPVTPTKSLSGWVMTGGVFTNNPATDTQFRIAASASDQVTSSAQFRSDSPITFEASAAEEKSQMSDQKTASQADNSGAGDSVSKQYHETETATLRAVQASKDGEINQLRATAATLQESNSELRVQIEKTREAELTATAKAAAKDAECNRLIAEAKGLREANRQVQQRLTEATEKLNQAKSEAMATRALEASKQAIKDGVAPALFEGIEADPASFVESRFSSIEAFEAHCLALSGVFTSSARPAAKSGHDPALAAKKAESESNDSVDPETAAKLDAIGLTDLDIFDGVTNEAEARRALAAASKTKE